MGQLISNVIEQHADAASILWLRRDLAVRSPHYRLDDLKKLDDQLDANLDGLRLAGEVGWEISVDELRWREHGEVFVAAVLALECLESNRLDRVLDVIGTVYELSRPLVSALGWLPWKRASDFVDRFLEADDPRLRRLGIAVAAVHRHDPGEALTNAIEGPEELLRARALRAVGELGRSDLLGAVRDHLDEGTVGCRFASAWSVALLAGDAEAVLALQEIVESEEGYPAGALQLVLRRFAAEDGRSWIDRLAEHAESVRTAVIGAGVLGAPDLVPWLFDQMQVPPVARVAGEAFAMITGVDIAYEDLDGEWPDGFEAGPTEDPRDENVEMDPDENLPWPDRAKLTGWWRKHRDRFEPGTRYLLGRPMTVDWLHEVLRNGYQRQRAAAALELAIRQPAAPLFEVRAPAWRQRELLG